MNKKSIKKVLAMMISILLINMLLIEVKVTATNGQVGEETITDTDINIEEEDIPNTDSDINEEDIPNTDSDINEEDIPNTDSDIEEEAIPNTDSNIQEDTTSDNDSQSEEITTPNSKDKFLTTETFINEGDKYSLWYILENYNLFSFEDATSNHIVGPVIAKGKVRHSDGGSLSIADLANGIPSYVGDIDNTFVLNYGHENTKENFKVPTFYSRSNYIEKVEEAGEIPYFINSNNIKVQNPNHSGKGPTKLNDSYIDFTLAKNDFISESLELLKVESETVSPEQETGYLELHVGKNYTINNSENLRVVHFIYPEGYDPYTNPYPIDTIINITGDGLASTGKEFKWFSKSGEIAGKEWKIGEGGYTVPTNWDEVCKVFPKIYVNGTLFSGQEKSDPDDHNSVDYGEFNNIIWNMPKVGTGEITSRVVPSEGTSILGHILAPNADFEACKGVGGNIHGNAIVNSWYAPNTEMHFYPYKNVKYGEELPPTGGQGVKNLLLLGFGMMFIALIALKRNKLYLK